jgi:shikimate 5-dehydrogenase
MAAAGGIGSVQLFFLKSRCGYSASNTRVDRSTGAYYNRDTWSTGLTNLEYVLSASIQYNFSGRHAVITGGGAGIGLAIAHRLAAGGARISLWDRNPAILTEAAAGFGGKSQYG